MLRNAKVGDRLWSQLRGWGKVIGETDTALSILHDDGSGSNILTSGKISDAHINPVVFWDEIEITPPPPPVQFKNVNGFKVPDMTYHPETGGRYYFVCLHLVSGVDTDVNVGNPADEITFARGLAYPHTDAGFAAARAHAWALLGEGEPFDQE